MFDSIFGTLEQMTPERITLQVGGIGYSLHIALSTFENLPPIGEPLKLYTTLIVREDSHKLYGFISEKERNLFDRLTEVSGIGPRLAITLLGHMSPEDFLGAIESENLSAICRVPGIGKKMGQRLILEMHDTLQKFPKKFISSSPHDALSQDAISALIHLGYKPLQAQKSINKILKNTSAPPPLSELISLALKTEGQRE